VRSPSKRVSAYAQRMAYAPPGQKPFASMRARCDSCPTIIEGAAVMIIATRVVGHISSGSFLASASVPSTSSCSFGVPRVRDGRVVHQRPRIGQVGLVGMHVPDEPDLVLDDGQRPSPRASTPSNTRSCTLRFGGAPTRVRVHPACRVRHRRASVIIVFAMRAISQAHGAYGHQHDLIDRGAEPRGPAVGTLRTLPLVNLGRARS
jgi:hypothetical protein